MDLKSISECGKENLAQQLEHFLSRLLKNMLTLGVYCQVAVGLLVLLPYCCMIGSGRNAVGLTDKWYCS